MQRVYLTRQEKQTLRLLLGGCSACPPQFPPHIYAQALTTLQTKGFVTVAWLEGHTPLEARPTPYARAYIATNPRLHNPINWSLIISTAAGLISAAAAIIAAITACTLLHR